MKPQELKDEYVRLRAEGRSYSYIASELHISKSTCSKWERELEAQIARLKKEKLNTLYESYGMTKEARIRRIGDTLERVEEALAVADLSEVAPEKLLDYKLKYSEALQKEYNKSDHSFGDDEIDAKAIVRAHGDLIDRLRAGDITAEQAQKESQVLANLLKAYETVEIKTQLDVLKDLLTTR